VEPTATPENVRVLVEREALEPVPVKVTVWGLPLALSVMVRVPLTVPVAVGVKVTLIEQVPPAAMPVPQVLVSAKLLLTVMPEKVSSAVPELVTVTDCAALVTFTPLERVRLLEDRLIAGVPVLVVLLEPPPQLTNTNNPARTANRQLRVATERLLWLIAPPPE
jgi:hypothetical protein